MLSSNLGQNDKKINKGQATMWSGMFFLNCGSNQNSVKGMMFIGLPTRFKGESFNYCREVRILGDGAVNHIGVRKAFSDISSSIHPFEHCSSLHLIGLYSLPKRLLDGSFH